MGSFGKWVVVALCLASASGCVEQVQGKAEEAADQVQSEAAAASAEDILIPVQAAPPLRQDMSVYFETTARVIPESRVEVVAKTIGQCKEVRIQEGDRVEKGDVLAILDGAELEAQIRQTQVNIAQAKYQMETAKEQYEKGVLSEFEAKMPRFSYDQAAAMLDIQKVQLDNLTIRAPISGTVTLRILQPGMQVAMGIPLFSVSDPQSFVLPISVPEKELTRLKVGQEAEVSVDASAGEPISATVSRINPSVDPVTGTVKVVLSFDEADRATLREAAFARVRLVMDTHVNALVLPKDTILEENGRKYVMVVREETSTGDMPALKAERIEIETGLEDSNHIEVLSGIDETTRVITLGQHTLKAGAAVKLTKAEDEIDRNVLMSAEEALAKAKDKEDLGSARGDSAPDPGERLLR